MDIFSGKRILPNSYNRLMKTFGNSLIVANNDVVTFRLKVLKHGEKYGWRAAKDAFGVSKPTYYRWKQISLEYPSNPLKLTPRKTKPGRVRTMKTDYRLVELIKQLRETHGNLSKYKLKPFVDALCSELNISTISVSTIGKIIKRKHLFYDNESKLIPVDRRKKKQYQDRIRVNRSPKIKKPGYLELDCVTTFINGIKYQFVCCIDVYTRLALARCVPTLSSSEALFTFLEFLKLYPVKITTVQTDNGSEFLGEFDQYLSNYQITHYFTYPRCPKINGHVERFNRTIQEEFINRNDEIYYDLSAFRAKLTKWLHFYNFTRPHQALNYLTPYQFLQSSSLKSG